MSLGRKTAIWASGFIYAALIIIPFVSSFSSAAANVFIGLSILAFLLKKVVNKELGPRDNAINIPFLLMVLVALLSFVNSRNIGSSWGGIGKLATFGSLFMILAEEVRNRRHLKWIIVSTLAGLYMASLDGVYQLYFGKDFLRNMPYDFVINLPRLRATFPHTNIFAGYLTLLLPVASALALYYLKGKKKALLGLMTVLSVFCLIFTFCRSAILGFAIALIFMALVKKDKIVLSLVLFSLIIGPFLLPKSAKEWIKGADSVLEVLINKERVYIWKTSLNMIKAHPVIGSGVNTFSLNYHDYKPKDTYGATGDGYYAHNIFLHMAGEIGLLGLALFFWVLFSFFGEWRAFWRRKNDTFLRICGLGISAGIIAFLINGLTETNLYYPKIATLFWYQVGLFLGVSRISRQKEKENG